MNTTTKWYEHPLFQWGDADTFLQMKDVLAANVTKERISALLEPFENVVLDDVTFYPAGTYSEPEKAVLDNIDDFYLIRMKHLISKNHTGTMRLYLPVRWNGRFMGMAGAGTNNEVDWFTSVMFNVVSWPMALFNGYAGVVADNDTGIRLDCTWGFDKDGNLEWDHIESWAYETPHLMTVVGKALTRALYGREITASYMHGTSGGGRQVITEAALYPEDYDGLWADGPAINNLSLMFSCLWAPVVDANENHIVALSKYQKAFELAVADPGLRDVPFDSRQMIWMDFIHSLRGVMTEDGPISQRDLDVMVKTWDGPFTKEGKRMGYGFGPAIQQWPLPSNNSLYGYLRRREDGRLGLMPIAEQALRWFTDDPALDIHQLSYEEFEQIYTNLRKKFIRYDFNDCDFTAFAARGGKLIITHGTGDCVVPYQGMIDYYGRCLEHFPSEKIMNRNVRLYMPYLAGHSIVDWSGAAVSIADGMKFLTAWAEEGKEPDILPTVHYDFTVDKALSHSEVPSFEQWRFRKHLLDKLNRR